MGTAFKIGEGLLLSCKHNFENITDFKIISIDKREWLSEQLNVISHEGQGIDLARIELKSGQPFTGKPIYWEDSRETDGELLLMGYPRVPSAEPGLATKRLGADLLTFDYLESKKNRLYFNDSIQGGYSGSPVLDSTAHLYALLTSRVENQVSETVSENIFGRAIPVEEIRDWLRAGGK